MPYVKMCKHCAEAHKDDIHNGYYEFIRDDIYVCPICNSKLIDTTITRDEYLIIINISNDNLFIQSMIKLKQDNIIEFQARIGQFKIQLQQEKQLKETKQREHDENKIICPKCGSPNIQATNRGFSLVTGFIGSGSPRNVFKKCGFKWKPGGWNEALQRDLNKR